MKYNLGTNQHRLLVEALRRFELFAVIRDGRNWTLEDLQLAWTGLGTETDYKPVSKVFMKPATTGAPRCNLWWCLTEKGARIVLHWHEKGYGCHGSCVINKWPPSSGVIEELTPV